jgi:hypothetical protein
MQRVIPSQGVNGVSVFSNAVPASGRVRGNHIGVPVPGSGINLKSEVPVVEREGLCSELSKSGALCSARQAKGTEMCVGHLRSAGKL